MPRDYATVRPSFWTGDTGRQLRAQGPLALLMGQYLMTCPGSNLIGLYYLPLVTVAHECALSIEGAREALGRAFKAGFCQYDEAREEVWIPEFAAHQVGREVSPRDNRHKAIVKEAKNYQKSKFFGAFVERYGAAYDLPFDAPDKPLASPLQAPSESLPRDYVLVPDPVPDLVLAIPQEVESTAREGRPVIPGKPKDRAQAALVLKHHAEAAALLVEWNAARKRANPKGTGLHASYDNLGPIAARLDEGDGAADRIRHVIAVCEAATKSGNDLKWFNPFTALVSNWTRNLSAVPTAKAWSGQPNRPSAREDQEFTEADLDRLLEESK